MNLRQAIGAALCADRAQDSGPPALLEDRGLAQGGTAICPVRPGSTEEGRQAVCVCCQAAEVEGAGHPRRAGNTGLAGGGPSRTEGHSLQTTRA